MHAAIVSYEQAQALPISGEPTQSLLRAVVGAEVERAADVEVVLAEGAGGPGADVGHEGGDSADGAPEFVADDAVVGPEVNDAADVGEVEDVGTEDARADVGHEPGAAAAAVAAPEFFAGDAVQLAGSDGGVTGEELWRSDGTSSGTGLVADIRSGIFGSNIFNLTNVGGTLYFRANDGVVGDELWRAVGTVATLVSDIRPGPAGSFSQNYINVGGTLYFSANDGTQQGLRGFAADRQCLGLLVGDDRGVHEGRLLAVELAGIEAELLQLALDGAHGVGDLVDGAFGWC